MLEAPARSLESKERKVSGVDAVVGEILDDGRALRRDEVPGCGMNCIGQGL